MFKFCDKLGELKKKGKREEILLLLNKPFHLKIIIKASILSLLKLILNSILKCF